MQDYFPEGTRHLCPAITGHYPSNSKDRINRRERANEQRPKDLIPVSLDFHFQLHCMEIIETEPGPAIPLQPPSRIFTLPPIPASVLFQSLASLLADLSPGQMSVPELTPPSSETLHPVQVFRPIATPFQSPSSDSPPPFHSLLKLNHPIPASHPDNWCPILSPIQSPPSSFQPARSSSPSSVLDGPADGPQLHFYYWRRHPNNGNVLS